MREPIERMSKEDHPGTPEAIAAKRLRRTGQADVSARL